MEHGVTVISDEIHCELVFAPHKHISYASLGEEFAAHSVTCSSPSKAFNIAGLQIANIFVQNPTVRRAVDRALNINEVCDVNPFGVLALIAAYRHGAVWLDELNAYLWENYQTLCAFFAQELPTLSVTRLEGTYLVWIDCRSLGRTSDELKDYLYEHGKVWINSGAMYGAEGEGFIRINIACPRQLLLEGLNRIKSCLSEH
jgi:cystathionine beta-lyase